MVTTSPPGLFIFHAIDVTQTVRLAGERGVAYLMGNNTLMEHTFRHQPTISLHAPLHTVRCGNPGTPAYFTFDKPSDQFGSFANAKVSAVGVELDRKMAALLEHLGVAEPQALTGRTSRRRLLSACQCTERSLCMALTYQQVHKVSALYKAVPARQGG